MPICATPLYDKWRAPDTCRMHKKSGLGERLSALVSSAGYWRGHGIASAAVAIASTIFAIFLVLEHGFAPTSGSVWWWQLIFAAVLSYSAYGSFRVANLIRDTAASEGAAGETPSK